MDESSTEFQGAITAKHRDLFSICDVASEVHAAYTGASEPMAVTQLAMYRDWLSMRSKLWTPQPNPLFRRYDLAVFELLVAALAEANLMLDQKSPT